MDANCYKISEIIAHHIAQCEANTVEWEDIDPIPIYHYNTWRNPTMPNMKSTQQGQEASYTCNNKKTKQQFSPNTLTMLQK